MTKGAVFMDWQNVYRAAHEAFELQQAPPERGNFDPRSRSTLRTIVGPGRSS
jgi:hypothetical protein